jgi:hypothetical protein
VVRGRRAAGPSLAAPRAASRAAACRAALLPAMRRIAERCAWATSMHRWLSVRLPYQFTGLDVAQGQASRPATPFHSAMVSTGFWLPSHHTLAQRTVASLLAAATTSACHCSTRPQRLWQTLHAHVLGCGLVHEVSGAPVRSAIGIGDQQLQVPGTVLYSAATGRSSYPESAAVLQKSEQLLTANNAVRAS